MKKENSMPKKIKKRYGSVVNFDELRIKQSIKKAMFATNQYDEKKLEKILDDLLNTITSVYDSLRTPTVEEIQDIIEVSLMKNDLFEVAKAYIIYREEKTKIREEKKKLLNKKTPLDNVEKNFSTNAIRVLTSRYLMKDKDGKIKETIKELFTRVSINATLAEFLYDTNVYDKTKSSHKNKEEIDKISRIVDNFEEESSHYNLRYGKYKLNKFHFRQLTYAFRRLSIEGKIKISFDEFADLFKKDYFSKYSNLTNRFYQNMINQNFMPNTPALVNSGRPLSMLSACFTLDVEDDLNDIMKLAHDVAMIQKMGGGTGMNFSKLREEGDVVGTTNGVASGPNSFLKMIDAVSDIIKQGGVRRAANMGILEIWHPDIEKFIRLKEKDGTFANFNISVGVWNTFWEALRERKSFDLISPRTGEKVGEAEATTILELIAYYAWLIADPGMLFFDNINKRNVLKKAKGGPVRVTNPCGEEPLYPYESCNLASINLKNMISEEGKNPELILKKYEETVKLAARFLENSIEINHFPIKKVEENTLKTRRIGVGMMGLADALFKLGIRYNSQRGFQFMNDMSEKLTYWAYKESVQMSKERGPFPLFYETDYVNGDMPIEGYYHKDEWKEDWSELSNEIKSYGLRNAMVSTDPPTGSVSMIADTSSGIEPLFALAFEKNVTIGSFYYVNPTFEEELKKRNLYTDSILKKITQNNGSVKGIKEIPKEIQEIFVTSMDIHWVDHIVAQSTMQRWVTDSISKTINMKNNVSIEDIKAAYILAKFLGCKGITVYRDGSKFSQVLSVENQTRNENEIKVSKYSENIINELLAREKWLEGYFKIIYRKEESSKKEVKKTIKLNIEEKKPEKEDHKEENRCPICGAKTIFESGCERCPECGWSKCTVS